MPFDVETRAAIQFWLETRFAILVVSPAFQAWCMTALICPLSSPPNIEGYTTKRHKDTWIHLQERLDETKAQGVESRVSMAMAAPLAEAMPDFLEEALNSEPLFISSATACAYAYVAKVLGVPDTEILEHLKTAHHVNLRVKEMVALNTRLKAIGPQILPDIVIAALSKMFGQ